MLGSQFWKNLSSIQRGATLYQRSTYASSRLLSSVASSANDAPLFSKVLVANRGEIACRVIQTCQALNIKTVAVYSEADVNSRAVKMADEAVCIGPAPSVDSYLRIDKILQAVKDTGATAVHPGYGFLSENKEFSLALADMGVKFIGPGAEAIRAMGDKIESKQIAMDAGVHTIPGFQGVIETPEEAVKIANDVGYPVMIKASAGGGGKGMRVAYNDEETLSGYRLSKEEAASSFGDDRIFIEKFIEDPRHIEIQIIADAHGNVVPFPERECSIQRRNQKVIEEAPSVLLTPEVRKAMGDQAILLAKAVGYESAGTLEFLCDKNLNFYFLEMNTRLQVEHPVTELVAKVDLVEQMLKIAAGQKIDPSLISDKPLPIHGWAMESRVYAEDPIRNFLPSIGRLLEYREPTGEGDNDVVRVDSGVTEGSDISMYYDPMISKLITHGSTRDECRERMQRALNQYVIRGPGHNLGFLSELYRHPKFQSGNITTKFIEEEYPEGFKGVVLSSDERKELIAASALCQIYSEEAAGGYRELGDVKKSDVFKLVKSESNVVPTFKAVNNHDDVDLSSPLPAYRTLFVSPEGPFGAATEVRVARIIDGNDNPRFVANVVESGESLQSIVFSNTEWPSRASVFTSTLGIDKDGEEMTLQVLSELPEGFELMYHGAVHPVVVRTPREHELSQHMVEKPKVDTSKLLVCPMPGMLVSVAVSVGDSVEAGQELAVVEAMKMQNVLRAEKSAVISAINFNAGDSLKVEDIILEFE